MKPGTPGTPGTPGSAPGTPTTPRPATPVSGTAGSENTVVEPKPAPRSDSVSSPLTPNAHNPQARLSTSAAPSPVSGSTPESSGTPRSSIAIPVSWIYWGITIAVVALVIVWSGGVLAGKRDAEDKFGKSLTGGSPSGEPQNQASGPALPPVEPSPAPQPESPTVTPTPTGEFYAAGEWTNTDPREKGMNYLRLVTLDQSEAVRAIDYLKSKGRRAIAVPSKTVDRGPDGGKNPSYFVYLLTPLTRDQYRDTATRTRIENEVKALGKEWAKNSKQPVPSDFAQPGWVKFD